MGHIFNSLFFVFLPVIKMLLIFGVVLLLIFSILMLFWKMKISRFEGLKMAPYYPIIGSCLHLETEAHKFFKQIRKYAVDNDYCFVLWFFFHPALWVAKVEGAELVLKSQEIITKSYLYHTLHPWLGTGLLTSTHQKWKSRRRAITPSFHFTILNDFQKIFIKQSQILVQNLKSYAVTGEAFDAQIPVSLATLDIICETAMGVSVNAQDHAESEYVNAINAGSKLLQQRQKSPWLWPEPIYWITSQGKQFKEHLRVLHSFTANVINDNIKARQSGAESAGRKTKAFMDMLLDLYEKGEIDIEGIREEVDTFMFEGHDTTAAGLSWTLFQLGLNPKIQQKLHEEIDKVADKEEDLVEKIRGIKYLEYVVKEGLRLHPPVAVFARELEQDTKIYNVSIPKGTTLMIDAISLHTNPEYWDEPEKFNPDRFSDEKYVKRNPYCYIPFSAGPRNCIGQKFAMLEEKILLYHVMLNYEVKTAQKMEDVAACFELIHKSENGLQIQLKKR
ncbi:cytochrome P450 4V2-like [Clytia hemisphaerica]